MTDRKYYGVLSCASAFTNEEFNSEKELDDAIRNNKVHWYIIDAKENYEPVWKEKIRK